MISACSNERKRRFTTTFVTVGKVAHHSWSLLRSDGKSPQVDNAVVIVVVVVVGDLVLILEVTGKDNPAALIATLSGIVMNGWLDCDEFANDATVPIRKSQGKSK